MIVTPSLPSYHLKTTNKSAKIKLLSHFILFFFALVCETVFIKTHDTERRCVIGLENILFAGACINFTCWGWERVN